MYAAFLSAPFGAGHHGDAGRSAQTERTRAHDFLPEAVGAGTGGRTTALRRRCGLSTRSLRSRSSSKGDLICAAFFFALFGAGTHTSLPRKQYFSMIHSVAPSYI